MYCMYFSQLYYKNMTFYFSLWIGFLYYIIMRTWMQCHHKGPNNTLEFFQNQITFSLLILWICEINLLRAVVFNPVLQAPLPSIICFPNQTHLIQLEETARPELGVSDKGDIQNMQCRGACRTGLKTTGLEGWLENLINPSHILWQNKTVFNLDQI